MLSLKLIAIAAMATFALADNVDTVITAFSSALDKLDIPEDRRTHYKAGLEKSRECLAPLTNEVPPERIAVYVEKLTPVMDECSKSLASIDKEKVKERQEAFAACLKEKVQGADSGFDEKQKETLPKVKECVVKAIHAQ